MVGQQGPMPPIPPQHDQQGMIYDAPNCDYDPPSYMDQNFGNPYDCPEGNDIYIRQCFALASVFFIIRYPAIIPRPTNNIFFKFFIQKLGGDLTKNENILY